MGGGGFVGGEILDVVVVDARAARPLENRIGIRSRKGNSLRAVIRSRVRPLDGHPGNVDALAHGDVVLGMVGGDGSHPNDITDPPGVLAKQEIPAGRGHIGIGGDPKKLVVELGFQNAARHCFH